MDRNGIKGSFRVAARDYIDSKINILSPRTVKEYEKYLRNLPEHFLNMQMNQITRADVQKLVNELTIGRAPKTVRNYHGFVSAVLSPYITLKTTLPRVEMVEPYIPTREDYNRLLEAFSGTQYHVIAQLMYHGLRRGEVIALTLDDIEDTCVHVTKDMVINSQNEWVIKPPKTAKSRRIVPIEKELADEIRKQGYIFKGHPNAIGKAFRRTQDRLGIPRFNPHSLRHLFVSVLLDGGCDMATAQDVGGWETSYTIEKHYRQSIQRGEKRRNKVLGILNDYLK